MGLYDFGWLATTDGEIKVSNGGGNLVISKGGEKSGRRQRQGDPLFQKGRSSTRFGEWW